MERDIVIEPPIEDRGGPELATMLSSLSQYERAKLAVHTAALLNPGPEDAPLDEDQEDHVREMFKAITLDPDLTISKTTQIAKAVTRYKKPEVAKLDKMLSALDEELIDSAARLRAYVTNKLLDETENPDGKIRIRALELIGKIKDVGLFSDKLEITHKNKSDDELEAEIQKRLERFMGTATIVDAEEVEDEDMDGEKPVQPSTVTDPDTLF